MAELADQAAPKSKAKLKSKTSAKAKPEKAKGKAKARAKTKPTSETRPVLSEYVGSKRIGTRTRRLLFVGLGVFCFLYGFMFAFLAPFLMVAFAVPVVFLAALVLWALPETGKPPIKTLEFLFFSFFTALLMWPNYLAIALPGLPWITVLRLVTVPLALTLLICLSVSTEFRSKLSIVLQQSRWLWRLIAAFLAIQILSIAFSQNKGTSVNILISVLIGWIFPFFAGCYILSKDEKAERFVALMGALAVALGVIGLWEHKLNHVPWAGHIPSFLQVDDPNVERFLAGTSRIGQAHRVQATFTTSLGLSEYLALVMPFMLHFAASRYRMTVRVLAGCTVPVLIGTAVLSQARVGLVGMLLAALVYPLTRTFFYWRRNPQNLASSTVVLLSPVLFVAGLVVAYLIPGIRYRVLGGGSDQYSNQARVEQLHMGMPKILSQPWGHGIGQGADTLGYVAAGGNLTIDSYPLRLALEYGIVGFLLYYAIFAVALISAARSASALSKTEKPSLFVPIGIALLCFAVMQTAFAQEDNHPVVFTLFGMLAALTYRHFGAKQHAETPDFVEERTNAAATVASQTPMSIARLRGRSG
jgi:hypothetical protein